MPGPSKRTSPRTERRTRSVRATRPTPPPPELHRLAAGFDVAWARMLVLTVVLGLVALFAWRVEASVDFGFHLVTGRWILEHHAWPRLDPFTYTASDHPYVTMHGLFQVALALADRAGGLVGIGLVRVALAVLTFAVVWMATRRRGVRSPELLALGFGLGIVTCEVRFMARPEMMTLLLLPLELYLLRRHSEDGRRAWLGAVVLVQWLWTLSHALSLFGIAVFGLYALMSSFGQRRVPASPRAAWVALAAAVVIMVLNPYGLEGVAFLWNLRSRVASGNIFEQTILELQSPFGGRVFGLWLVAFKALFVASVIALIVRIRALPRFDLAVAILFGFLAATRVRSIGLFVVAVLPIALAAASECVGLVAAADRAWFRPAWRTVGVLAVAGLLVVAGAVVSGRYYAHDFRSERFGYEESPGTYPIRTVDTIERHALPGPMYNELEYGGYLIRRLWPRQHVYIDGRLEVMGDALYAESLRIRDQHAWLRISRQRRFDYALVAHKSMELIRDLDADSAWALVDADGVAALFVRRTSERAAWIAEAESTWSALDAPPTPSEPPFLPPPPAPLSARLFGSTRFDWDTWGRGSTMAAVGRLEAARREYARALQRSDYEEPQLVRAYAGTLFVLHRTHEAIPWMRRLIEIAPRDQRARQALASLLAQP